MAKTLKVLIEITSTMVFAQLQQTQQITTVYNNDNSEAEKKLQIIHTYNIYMLKERYLSDVHCIAITKYNNN